MDLTLRGLPTPINAGIVGDNLIAAGKAGLRIMLLQYLLVPSAATTVKFRSNTGVPGTDLTPGMAISSPGLGGQWTPSGHVVSKVGEGLYLNSTAGTITGYCIVAYVAPEEVYWVP